MRCAACVALLVLNAACAASADGQALELTIEKALVQPGEEQRAFVAGLYPREGFGLAWLDPTGRVRGAWELDADRRGARTVRVRLRRAIPGAHRLVLRRGYAHGEAGVAKTDESRAGDAAEVSFQVLPGEAPAYIAALDAPSPGEEPTPARQADDAAAARAGFSCVAASGRAGPGSLGGIVRILDDGPPFLHLDEDRIRALRAAPEETTPGPRLGGGPHARPVCLRDRSRLGRVWRWVWPRAEEAARFRPWLWSLGEGVWLAPEDGGLDFCRSPPRGGSPSCARAFARDLLMLHGGIGPLNWRWGTEFTVPADVRAPTTRELLKELGDGSATVLTTRRAAGALAAWSDHRSFMDRTWAEALSLAGDIVRSVDGRARVGLEGVELPGVFTGGDPSLLLPALDWVEVRPRPLDMALARSFMRPRSRIMTSLCQTAGFQRSGTLRSPIPAIGLSAAVVGDAARNVRTVGVRGPDRVRDLVEGDTPGGTGSGALRSALWRGLANGHGGAILHVDDPDLAGAGLKRTLATIASGPGELVARSTWEPDLVAVLYSHRSVQVEWALAAAGRPPDRRGSRRGSRRAGRALAAWVHVLSDIGLTPRLAASEDVARGALREPRVPSWRRTRALILPRAYVLSREEQSEIVRFARAGGLVVADSHAGVFDKGFDSSLLGEPDGLGHDGPPAPVLPASPSAGRAGRPRGGRAVLIEDIFGITRRDGVAAPPRDPEEAPAPPPAPAGAKASSVYPAPPRSGSVTFAGTGLPGAYTDGVDRSSIRLVERGLRASTGHALARAPDGAVGLVTNPYGKGRGVYLNTGLETYVDRRATPEGASLRRLVRNVLELGRVRPRVEIIRGSRRGEPVPGCERIFRRLEETVIFAVHRDPAFGTEPVEAELVFPESHWRSPGYCYDLIDGVLIGRSRRVRVRLSPGVRVFVYLPYDVEDITIKSTPVGREGRRAGVVRFRAVVETSTGMAGTHLICQELRNEADELVPGGSRVLVARRGVVKGEIAFARNEPEGTYRLILRDVTSGVEGEIAVTLDRETPVGAAPLRERFPLGPAFAAGAASAE